MVTQPTYSNPFDDDPFDDDPQSATKGRRFKRASEFEPETVTWLWSNRIPVGKFAIIDGDPGLGKSLITIDLISKVTTGGLMPDSKGRIEKGGVVLIAPEDGTEDTIIPRLLAAGADLDQVIVLSTIPEVDQKTEIEYQRPISFPSDIDTLRAAIEEVNASLVVIDPVLSVLNSATDSHKDHDVRTALMPIIGLAKEKRCSIVGIMHLNKGSSPNALYRSGGSIAFSALARSTMRVVKDPDNSDGCVLVHHKRNLSKQAGSLRFQVAETANGRPHVTWLGESALSTDELLTPSARPSESRQAIQRVIRESDKPLTIPEIAERAGIENTDTLNRTLNRMVNEGELAKPARGLYTSDRRGNNGLVHGIDSIDNIPNNNMSDVSETSECLKSPQSDKSDNGQESILSDCPLV